MSSPARRSVDRVRILIRSSKLPIQNRNLSISCSKAKGHKDDNTSEPVLEQAKQSPKSSLNLPYDSSTPSIWKRSKAKAARSIWEISTVLSSDDKYDFGTGPFGRDIAYLERIWKRSKGEVVPEPAPEQPVKKDTRLEDTKQTNVQDEIDNGRPKYVACGPLFWNAEKRKKEKEAKERAKRKKDEDEASKNRDRKEKSW